MSVYPIKTSELETVQAAYADCLNKPKPTGAAFELSRLSKVVLVGIEAIAAKPL